MAKLCPRRLAPMRTLKQLAHIKSYAPTCNICGERVYKIGCKMHKCNKETQMFKDHQVVTDTEVGDFIRELYEQENSSTPLEEIQNELARNCEDDTSGTTDTNRVS